VKAVKITSLSITLHPQFSPITKRQARARRIERENHCIHCIHCTAPADRPPRTTKKIWPQRLPRSTQAIDIVGALSRLTPNCSETDALILRSAIALKVWQHQLIVKGKPWLVRELPKNRRRTEVLATLQWQHWCHRQAHSKLERNRMLVGAALFYVSVTMFVALNSIASHGAEIPPAIRAQLPTRNELGSRSARAAVRL
jgi:hypothetical protein